MVKSFTTTQLSGVAWAGIVRDSGLSRFVGYRVIRIPRDLLLLRRVRCESSERAAY